MSTKFVLVGLCRHESYGSICKFSSYLSKQNASWVIGQCRPLKHAANLVLDQWDLSTNLCLKDLLVLPRYGL